MEYDLVNRPHKLSRQEYTDKINDYIKAITVFEGVIAVYSMGSIKCPGLSDIDLIVIIDDDFQEADKLSVRRYIQGSEFFIHDVLVFNKAIFQEVQYILYASNLTLLWNKNEFDIPIPYELSEDEKIYQSISLGLDFAVSRVYEYLLVEEEKVINMRSWYTRIHSFVHTYDLLCKIIPNKQIPNDIHLLVKKLFELREDWNNDITITDDRFLDLFHKTKSAFTYSLDSILEEVYKCTNIHDLRLNKIQASTWECVFDDTKKYNTEIVKTINIRGKNIFYSRLYLPYRYIYHVLGYISEGAKITKKYRKYQWTSGYLDQDYFFFQQKRISAIQSHISFLKHKKINYSMSGWNIFLPTAHLGKRVRVDDIIWKVLS